MTDSTASPFRLRDFCSGLYDVLHRADMYQDGDSLVECPMGGGPALTLVEMALELCMNPRTRRSIADLKQDWPSRGSKQWLLRFMLAAFKLFRFMLVLAKPMKVAETVPSTRVMTTLTKGQRLELRGSGLIVHWELPWANRVALVQERIREEMTQGCYVTWADQFNKSRYSKNLDGPRDISWSCTVVAVLTGPSVRLSYARWPSAEKLTTRVKDVALHMRESVSEFLRVVQDLGSDPLPLGLLRYPLDIRWGNPGTSSWQPYGLWDINVTKTAGLGDVLVRLLQDNPGNRNPVKVLLCEMNIWWRVAKVVYNREHAASLVRGALREICPVYAICHAYKVCVTALYKAFSPIFIYLEYDCSLMDPTATRVYQYPALIVLERLILSCYLPYPALLSQFDRGFRSFTIDSETSLWKEQWEALWELLHAYVPAVLQLGIMVRDCSWRHPASGNGVAAHKVLESSLFLLRKIKPTRGDCNYKNTIRIALLLWSWFHDALPSTPHVEEKGESMMSRLVKASKHDLNATTLEQYESLFLTIRKARQGTTFQQKPHITLGCVQTVQGRLHNLLHCLTSGTAPFVDIRTGEMEDNPKAADVTGTNIWPNRFKFPRALMDLTSLVESEYILPHQSVHTLFYLFGNGCDKADRRAIADQMIHHQQPPRGRDYRSFFDDYARTAAHLRGMLPHDAMASGLPIWEKIPTKRKRADDVGNQNGS